MLYQEFIIIIGESPTTNVACTNTFTGDRELLMGIERGKPLHNIEQGVDILPHPVCLLECTPVGHTLLLLYIMNSCFYKLIAFDRATISVIRSI